jgi:hypothetical protein
MLHALAWKFAAVEAVRRSLGRHLSAILDLALHTGLPFRGIIHPASGTWILFTAIRHAKAAVNPAWSYERWRI